MELGTTFIEQIKMTKEREIIDFFVQQRERENQLLSNVLKCFDEHKQNTLKDLQTLKHNLSVKNK